MRLFIALSLLTFSCHADEYTRRGEVGEFCNGRDTDCRPGLVCDIGVCAEPGPLPTYDCGDICNRLAECEVDEPGCEPDCRISTTPWALRAREEFGVCVVEELACSDAAEAFAPQTCYSRIEIPDERWTVCREFVNFAQTCGASTPDAERVLEGCAAIARVFDEDRWAGTARCASVAETGICSELATCFNSELGLAPVIEF